MASGADSARPAVSVIVPFLGSAADARELAASLERLELEAGDELIVADNTVAGVFGEAVRGERIAVVRSTGEHSSYRSRNAGAAAARNEWLLFLDSDCRPRGDLLARYFAEPIGERTGAVGGSVLALPRGTGRIARYEASRTQDKQALHLRNPYRPFAVTANLLVRRAGFEEVGGFQEGIRSGGDADFCWRVQEAGWELESREEASVEHLTRERLRAYLRLHARYGAGRRWLGIRHPRAGMGVRPQRAMRMIAGAVRWAAAGQLERGLFKSVDAAVVLAETAGYTQGNAGPRWPREGEGRRPRVAILAERFPIPSETFVVNEAQALEELGLSVRIEPRARPERPALGAAWGLDVRYLEDHGLLRQVADLAWLVGRHPIRCATDRAARGRWRREEKVTPLRVLAPQARALARDRIDHVHVHFARRAALDALRLQRLLGIPYSVTAHAWDIFRERSNLAEKVAGSAFVTTGCDYNVRAVRALVDPSSADRVHKIVMGVDPERFSRAADYDGDGTVIAIGRLVEKKGFEHLLAAAARLRDSRLLRRVVIVGDGELREELEDRAQALGVGELVRFEGAKRPAEVRDLLERSALLAMPAVVAADGDRDSMPVVVKEALAMGVPVVASDEVGLPEVVRDEWGRLVPPRDPDALADAIEELLAIPPEERARMGERGREFVLGEYSLRAQTAKLAELIERSG